MLVSNGLMCLVKQRINVQYTSPVETEDEDGKTSAVECETNPIEVHEQVSCQLLAVQHAKGGWV